MKDGKTRTSKIIKPYICIFICVASKAIHIEVISDLSTEDFLSVLTRFVSRRGLCSDIYSDNATNFVGRNNELIAISRLTDTEKFRGYVSNSNINLHFIPAKSPHFGGLWEAAVKSCKHHLKRVLNGTNLIMRSFIL